MLLLIVFDVEAEYSCACIRHSRMYNRESRKIDVMVMNRENVQRTYIPVTLSLGETIRLMSSRHVVKR